jgi:hypothetical protein
MRYSRLEKILAGNPWEPSAEYLIDYTMNAEELYNKIMAADGRG